MTRYLTVLAIIMLANGALAADPNALTKKEKSQGFKLLFNGKDLNNWKQRGNWVVKEGAIFRVKRGGGITHKIKRMPDDFELRFHWKVARGSNSGVYYRPGQYEYQILDNKVHRDGKNPRTSAASLYFCMAPSKDVTKPVGQWNTGKVICQGTVVQHWLNGVKVVDFDYSKPKWAFNVRLLKLRGATLNARGGRLNLQDHGDPVWYRGFKLRTLSGKEKLDRKPIQPAKIPPAVLQAEKKKLQGIVARRKKRKKK